MDLAVHWKKPHIWNFKTLPYKEIANNEHKVFKVHSDTRTTCLLCWHCTMYIIFKVFCFCSISNFNSTFSLLQGGLLSHNEWEVLVSPRNHQDPPHAGGDQWRQGVPQEHEGGRRLEHQWVRTGRPWLPPPASHPLISSVMDRGSSWGVQGTPASRVRWVDHEIR